MTDIPDGKVLGWIVYCPFTREPILYCATRKEAREEAEASGGRVAKVEASH